MTIEDLAKKAVDGDRDAVEQLVKDLQGDVYGLALRGSRNLLSRDACICPSG